MKTSSYLYVSNRKNMLTTRKMDKRSSKSNNNNMSADSLEDFKNKTSIVSVSDENVETVVVPFYEKDVLVKVPKEIRHLKQDKKKSIIRQSKDPHPSSYLVNKNMQSKRSSTYLEKFRNQFQPNCVENKQDEHEIRSISPEVGDTDRERSNWSFDEEQNNPVEEFHNTEAYNEIYYENLIQREAANYSDNSSDDGICFNDDVDNKSPHYNLRSVSEVSQPRRRLRRFTAEPVVNVKLGGLGPDVEMIRPQLMRARSLQRYSDKIRAANRVSIYKKTVTETTKQNKKECELKVSQKKSAQNTPRRCVAEEQVSYLVNKSSEKTVKMARSHNKSASPYKKCDMVATEEHLNSKSACKRSMENKHPKKTVYYGSAEKNTNDAVEVRVKSSSRSKTIKTEIKPKNKEVPPIHISFLVNVENGTGSALKSLEEKHRRYQEMVKQYVNDYS